MEELRNCLNCNWAKWEDSYKEWGKCEYPIPSCYKRYPLKRGIYVSYKTDRNGKIINTHTKDRSRVGYRTEDSSTLEIKECPTWERKELSQDKEWIINALLQQIRMLMEMIDSITWISNLDNDKASIIKDINSFREKLEGFGYGKDPF